MTEKQVETDKERMARLAIEKYNMQLREQAEKEYLLALNTKQERQTTHDD